MDECPSLYQIEIITFADRYINNLLYDFPIINTYVDLLDTTILGVLDIAFACIKICSNPTSASDRIAFGTRILGQIVHFLSLYSERVIEPLYKKIGNTSVFPQLLCRFFDSVIKIAHNPQTVNDYTRLYFRLRLYNFPLSEKFINHLNVFNPVSRYFVHYKYIS